MTASECSGLFLWSPTKDGALNGTFFSTPDVGVGARAIPYNPNVSYHAIIKVIKPLSVYGSIASPSPLWNVPGMGYQFQTVGCQNALQLKEAGYVVILQIRIGK